MKPSKLILFIGVLCFLNFPIHAQKNTFKVMAWNILHGGNDIENGPESVGKIISTHYIKFEDDLLDFIDNL